MHGIGVKQLITNTLTLPTLQRPQSSQYSVIKNNTCCTQTYVVHITFKVKYSYVYYNYVGMFI